MDKKFTAASSATSLPTQRRSSWIRILRVATLLGVGAAVSAQASTPGSIVYPRGNDCGSDACEGTAHRTLAARGTVKNSLGASIVELHGWVRVESSFPNAENTSKDPKEFDWHYGLELDPDWLSASGMDINELIPPGNIFLETQPDPLRASSKPIVHVELRSWTPRETKVTSRPAGWDFAWSDGRSFWPWDPRCSSDDPHCPPERALQTGDYVEMKGSLVTDDDHEYPGPEQWGSEQGRWVELHPPDSIQRKVSRPRAKGVLCIAVYSANGLLSVTPTVADFIVAPPPEAPKPVSREIVCEEMVGPETNKQTIMEGNAQKTGARITRYLDSCGVHIGVQGQRLWGLPGKFKATYLAYWKEVPQPPAPHYMITSLSPNPVLLDRLPRPNRLLPERAAGEVSVIVTAMGTDAQGATVQLPDAQVFIGTDGPFPTFQAFPYRFSSGFQDDLGQWSTTPIVVKHPGYADTPVDYLIDVRQ